MSAPAEQPQMPAARGLGDLITNIGKVFSTSPVDVPEIRLHTAGWRIEVLNGNSPTGRYWIWRKGSRNNRKSAYGGTFRTLAPDRQEAWAARREAVPGRDPGNSD
jgi:hypothetical protein